MFWNVCRRCLKTFSFVCLQPALPFCSEFGFKEKKIRLRIPTRFGISNRRVFRSASQSQSAHPIDQLFKRIKLLKSQPQEAITSTVFAQSFSTSKFVRAAHPSSSWFSACIPKSCSPEKGSKRFVYSWVVWVFCVHTQYRGVLRAYTSSSCSSETQTGKKLSACSFKRLTTNSE